MQALWAFSVLFFALALASTPSGGGGAKPPAQRGTSAAGDITLKTRTTLTFQTPAGAHTRVRTEAIYITSGRERRDMTWEAFAGSSSMSTSSIRDCAQHRWIMLEHEAQTYNVQPFPDVDAERATAERIAKARADIKAGRLKPTPIPPNAPVTTIETIDTGERREVAGLTLRHLRQTETTSGGDATEKPATSEGNPKFTLSSVQKRRVTRDGWYATLPEVRGCGESSSAGVVRATFTLLQPGLDVQPRLEFKGIPPTLGTAAEETCTTEYGSGTVTVDKTELVELSRAPVDPNLFDIPPDYREALHTPGGGRDMMQPDTLYNRARAWWQQLWPRWTFYSHRASR